MPTVQGFDMKMSLLNFLTLNNEHKRMSFTYLRKFDYNTMSLTEVNSNRTNFGMKNSSFRKFLTQAMIVSITFYLPVPLVSAAFTLNNFFGLPNSVAIKFIVNIAFVKC